MALGGDVSAETASATRRFPYPRHLTPYILVLPAVLAVALTVLYPIGWAISLSTRKYILFEPNDTPFVGVANFLEASGDPVFWRTLKNSGVYVVSVVSLQFLLGLGEALVLNLQFKGRSVLRAVALIPWVTPAVLTGYMWRWMYNVNYGLINRVAVQLGLTDQHIGFLTDPKLALPSVVLVTVWSGAPFFALMLLAAMQAVPEELYEVAKVDGANAVQRFLYVTVPSIASTIAVTTLLRIIWMANYVVVLYTMTGGGPGYASMTLPIYILLKAQSGLNMGYSSAMAIMLSTILMSIVAFYLWVMRKLELQLR